MPVLKEYLSAAVIVRVVTNAIIPQWSNTTARRERKAEEIARKRKSFLSPTCIPSPEHGQHEDHFHRCLLGWRPKCLRPFHKDT